MIQVHASVEIDRPAQKVFDYLSNFENNPAWQEGMRAARFTTDPPLRVGSTYEQEATFLGRRIVSRFEVTKLVPGQSITIATVESTFPIRVTRAVEQLDGARAKVSAVVEGDPSGVFRLASPFLRAMVQRSVSGDYRRLKQVLESSPG